MKVEDLVPLILKLCPDIKEQPGKVCPLLVLACGPYL